MPTQEQLKAGAAVIMAVAETIREAGECPSGTIYAVLMGRVTFQGYEKILGILKGAGLIEVLPSHLIRWIGPMKGVTA
ncbi:MAG TPA: hypothetical protein VKQ11_00575 [Candidatus Sulfotelmatobacter sp.]|nr:hypothetical protein [Candidatus Sulfotelmatobacter sp.]